MKVNILSNYLLLKSVHFPRFLLSAMGSVSCMVISPMEKKIPEEECNTDLVPIGGNVLLVAHFGI